MKTIQEITYTNGTIEEEVTRATEKDYWQLVTDWSLSFRDRLEIKTISISLVSESKEEKGFSTKPIYSFSMTHED